MWTKIHFPFAEIVRPATLVNDHPRDQSKLFPDLIGHGHEASGEDVTIFT
jgi:hypothetical protein